MQLINLLACIFMALKIFFLQSLQLPQYHTYLHLLFVKFTGENLFKRCIPIIIIIMIFNQQISFLYMNIIGLCSATNIIRHQFNGLGKDHSSVVTSLVFLFLSSGPLRWIHFHFAKYSALLIQCICEGAIFSQDRRYLFVTPCSR